MFDPAANPVQPSLGVAHAVAMLKLVARLNAVFNPPPASDGPVSKYPLAFPDRDVPMPLPQGPPVPLVPPPPGL